MENRGPKSNRSEFVRRLVLSEMCDDYENVDQIVWPHVAAIGIECGLVINRSEIVEAVTGLVQDRLADAYYLDAFNPECQTPLEYMPPLDLIEDETTERRYRTYFYVTLAGQELFRSISDSLPFDEDGEFIPGWTLDTADFTSQ